MARVIAASLIAVPALFVVFACGDDAAPAAPTRRVRSESSQGCGKAGAPKGMLEKQALRIKSNERTYDVVIPEGHDGKTPLPLVFVFHGSGGNGQGIRKAYDLEGQAQGKAVFVYPNADPTSGEWDLERKADANLDILFFDAILESLSVSHCVDRKRVFATGYSAGGYFSNQLACRRGSVLRAIASHAGGGPFGANDEYGDDGALRCPERPIAALVSHGTADGTVSLEEGQKSRDHWRRVNACKTGSGQSYDPSPCTEHADCADERRVIYCEVPGLGHEVWPANGVKATWSFFDSQ
jgi:polyhydroxybutyrate depolymerase